MPPQATLCSALKRTCTSVEDTGTGCVPAVASSPLKSWGLVQDDSPDRVLW